MSEESFQDQLRRGELRLPSGFCQAIPLRVFLKKLVRVLEVPLTVDCECRLQKSLTDRKFVNKKLLQVRTSFEEHLTNVARHEAENVGGLEWRSDEELRSAFVHQHYLHTEKGGAGEVLVQFPTGQFMFADPRDWVVVWGWVPGTMMERAALAICLEPSRSRQMFLPFRRQ